MPSDPWLRNESKLDFQLLPSWRPKQPRKNSCEIYSGHKVKIHQILRRSRVFTTACAIPPVGHYKRERCVLLCCWDDGKSFLRPASYKMEISCGNPAPGMGGEMRRQYWEANEHTLASTNHCRKLCETRIWYHLLVFIWGLRLWFSRKTCCENILLVGPQSQKDHYDNTKLLPVSFTSVLWRFPGATWHVMMSLLWWLRVVLNLSQV